MRNASFNLPEFLADPQALACVLPVTLAREAFRGSSWPAGWTAWATNPLGEDRLYNNALEADKDDIARLTLVRTGPVQMRFVLPDVSSRDDFECQVYVTVELRVSSEPADLKAFAARVLGSAQAFHLQDLSGLLEPKTLPLMRSLSGGHDAAELVDGTCRAVFAKGLCDGLAAFLFESGLTLCGGPTLRGESAQFSQNRKHRRHMTRAKEREGWLDEVRQCQRQAHERHLRHLEPLLEKLQQLADGSPDLELADLVRTFPEQERAEIYEALFKLRPPGAKTARVVVASAEELTVLDPADPHQPLQRRPLQGQAGLLRSVQWAGQEKGPPLLLVGAQRGVYLLDTGLAQPPQVYGLPGEGGPLRGGVNSVALSGQHLLASHSEVGLLRWRRDQPESGELLLAEQTGSAEAVRHVRRVGEWVWLTIDHRVLRLPADDLRAESATSFEGNAIAVTALYVDQARVLAGTQTGQILVWDLDDPGTPRVLEHGRGRPVGSVRVLPSGGLDRLIFADCSPGVTARFLTDAFACRYAGGGQELRWVLAAGDLIAAVNTQRDRLLLWHPYEPAEPFAVLPIARWTGHSIQDACLIPESSRVL